MYGNKLLEEGSTGVCSCCRAANSEPGVKTVGDDNSCQSGVCSGKQTSDDDIG